jgi:hypothetical protein
LESLAVDTDTGLQPPEGLAELQHRKKTTSKTGLKIFSNLFNPFQALKS